MTDMVNRNMFSVKIGDSFVEDPIVIQYSVTAKMYRSQRLSTTINTNRQIAFGILKSSDYLIIGFAESYEEADVFIYEYQKRMNLPLNPAFEKSFKAGNLRNCKTSKMVK